MNILITVVSQIKESNTKNTYSSKEKNIGKIEALQVNEACCKYLITKLGNENKRLDKAICLLTENVKKQVKNENFDGVTKSSYQHFIDSIKDYYEYPPDFLIIDLENSIAENSFDTVLEEIAKKISEIKNEAEKSSEISDKDITVYLDISGGPRNISVLIQQLTKLLSYYGYNVEAYYTSFDFYSTTGEFYSCENAYRQMDILDAVNEFVTTGKSKQLSNCFKNVENESVNKLLETLGNFTEAIQLCNVNIDKLDEILKNMKKRLNEVKNNNCNEENVFLLRLMIPLIEEQFFNDSIKSRIDYSQIIQWCLDNGYIQQALTIYVEKIPEYFFTKKFCRLTQIVNIIKKLKKKVKIVLLSQMLMQLFFMRKYCHYLLKNVGIQHEKSMSYNMKMLNHKY